MKPAYKLSALLPGLALLGCGGGNITPALSGDQAFAYGRLDGHSSGITAPVRTNSSNVSVIGQTGLIHALELQGDRDLAHTRIAFYSNQDNQTGIYTINPDGSNPTRISNLSDLDGSLVWSPDGSRIALVISQDGKDEIYVMNADGSHPTLLPHSIGSNSSPSWSPDGTKIAFASDRDGTWEIFVMNVDGSHLTRLTNPPVANRYPFWSPDGSKIAFVGGGLGSSDIYVMNADGSQPTLLARLPNNDPFNQFDFLSSPVWSPNGSRIAFVNSYDVCLYTMRSDGSNLTRLASNLSAGASPSWSPDGSRIVCEYFGHPRREILVVNTDGSHPAIITHEPFDNRYPGWSPLPPPRQLIGANGQMGITAIGFLYAQLNNNTPASIVTFNQASTYQPLILVSPSGLNSPGTALLYDLEAASLSAPITDLRFWNLTDPNPVQVTLASGLLTTEALIGFGADDGLVHSVLLFNGFNRSAGSSVHPQVVEANGQRVAKGHFLGVWDGRGKNLAPQGASEVVMDARTGEVLQCRAGQNVPGDF